MNNSKKSLLIPALVASLSLVGGVSAWTWSTHVTDGDLISVDKWNSLIDQLSSVSVQPDWSAVSGYAMILNKPTIPAAQVNSDWNSSSGFSQILNKPTIPSAMVNADWSAVSGYAMILNKPTIPAAQVNSDWNSASGFSQILNKPTIPAAMVNADWNSSSGFSQILNKPTIPAAQVNADWTSTSGVSMILNRPWTTSGTDQYSAVSGNVGIGASGPTAKLTVTQTTNNVAFQGNGGRYYLLPSSTTANQGLQIDTAGLANASNAIYVNAPTGWTGNIIKSNLNGVEQFAIAQNGTAWFLGNVGIGAASAGQKLEVSGTVKATKLNVSGGSHFKMNLAHCGGPCGSYHTLNVRTSAGGYTWSQVYNTDTSNYVKNSTGIVTVNEAGVYTIRLQAMGIPQAATSYMGAAYYCPFINGSANCYGDVGLEHRYGPAGYWTQGRREYTGYLTAGTTVSFGLHQLQAMTYWCHDSYCSVEIRKIN